MTTVKTSKIYDPARMARLVSAERHQQIPPQRVLDLMQLQQGDTLLDLGAGPGFFTFPALDYVGPTGRVIAVDIAAPMRAELERRAALLKPSNLTILPWPLRGRVAPGTMDQILMAFVVHEAPNQLRFLAAAARLLKPGGQLTVVDWEPVAPPPGPPLEQRYSFPNLVGWMERVGLSLVQSGKVNEYHFLGRFRRVD